MWPVPRKTSRLWTAASTSGVLSGTRSMRRRLLHWIGWNLGFSLLPLLAIALLAYLEPAKGRSVRAFLGSPDDTRTRWCGRRDLVTFGVVFVIS